MSDNQSPEELDTSNVNIDLLILVTDFIDTQHHIVERHYHHLLETLNDKSSVSRLNLQFNKWKSQVEEIKVINIQIYHLVKNCEQYLDYYRMLKMKLQ